MQFTFSKGCIRQALKLSGLATLAAFFYLFPGVASAQEVELEEITVTGSRIPRDINLSGALPVQSIGQQEIQLSGEFSIADIVNDIPALLSSTTSENSGESGFVEGANVLDLRGLGANRTLVLVNGRRHVGGVQGSAAVDVGSIPTTLVERVEVLTGGASAVYGADAVTGVVNIITKKNYEGLGIDLSYGLSEEGDAGQTAITTTWGTNFADDRGNFAISVDYRVDDGLKAGERPNGGGLAGTARDWVNPDLRFQIGDISAANTPLFEQFYNFSNNPDQISYGSEIPTADSFIGDYNALFGTNLTGNDLSPGELALLDRATNAPSRAVLPGRTFPFTSGYGYIAAGNAFTFGGFDTAGSPDLDGNGTPDCADSFTGFFSNQQNVGGCWNVAADGSIAPVQDGLVATGFQGFGGDSLNATYDVANPQGDIILPDNKITVNLLGHFDIFDSATIFVEAKYSKQKTDSFAGTNSFWDLLLGAPDNPFLPAALVPTAVAGGGISITVDPLHFQGRNFTERETVRVVISLEGEFDNNYSYEISANYGRHNRLEKATNGLINDRFLAAIDAVTDPATGQPACRIEVDPTAPGSTTPFNIPVYDPGYFSFTPGSGQCVPLNIWAGLSGLTQAAVDFVTVDMFDELTLDQTVIAAFLTGDTEGWLELPAGSISFAVGAEYRKETSDAGFDSFQRGVLPVGSPFPAGTNIADVSANSSVVFRPNLSTKNEQGEFDATDVYLEALIPLLTDVPGARELTLNVAGRFSDYSTIGETFTWKSNIVWAPIESFSIRGTYSEAVRAPNITELFGPLIGATFRPVDPCDFNQITAIRADNPTLADNTQANCIASLNAIGINTDPGGVDGYSFADPLSAAFGGVTGGNRNLTEETAETYTVGFVWQPKALEGFSFTADVWDIAIDDAINAVSSQSIVDGCYQGASLNQNFCGSFTRNPDNTSPQAGGFTFLSSSSINFARIETSGMDLSAKYAFEIGNHRLDITAQFTKVDKIDFFTNPSDINDVNLELGELYNPEWAGNVWMNWQFGNFGIGWQAQYQSQQLLGGLEIDTAESLYGRDVFMEAFWQHDLYAQWDINDNTLIYGGINNISGVDPFITERAFPASFRGRFLFIGADLQLFDR